MKCQKCKSSRCLCFFSLFYFISDIRLQLNEQLRCLDIRVESQISLIQELQEFYRKRGEVELDYSKSLEKLAKNLQLRHKEQKQKYVVILLNFAVYCLSLSLINGCNIYLCIVSSYIKLNPSGVSNGQCSRPTPAGNS